jgi:hypothetical protein
VQRRFQSGPCACIPGLTLQGYEGLKKVQVQEVIIELMCQLMR